MKRFVFASILALAIAFVSRTDAAGTSKTVNGWVLDSACAFTKGLTKPISRSLLVETVKKYCTTK